MKAARTLALVACTLGPLAAFGAAPAAPAEDAKLAAPSEAVDRSVNKALGYLMQKQGDDGAIDDRNENKTAMTSLGIMALAAAGHLPSDPTPEGRAAKKALDYILDAKRQDDNGYFGGRDGSRMYGHGITSLMLSEMLGMSGDEETDRRIRGRLEKAIRLILDAQNRKTPDNLSQYGGWRYSYDAPDSDLSVTIWQLMALRAARNAGITVPADAIERAVGYLKRCYREPAKGRPVKNHDDGACAYQVGQNPKYASAAAGLLALQVCGQYEAHETLESADWLLDEKLNYEHEYFFYGTYYYAQGMYQRGGDYAEQARKRVEDMLLPKQQGDGSWEGGGGREREVGRVYCTSLAVLSLAVRYHYLPIYQR